MINPNQVQGWSEKVALHGADISHWTHPAWFSPALGEVAREYAAALARAEKAEAEVTRLAARSAEFAALARQFAHAPVRLSGGTGDESDWFKCCMCGCEWRSAEHHTSGCSWGQFKTLLAELEAQR